MFKKSCISIDVDLEARKIVADHTEGVMSCGSPEFEDNMELWEFMLSECAFIISEKFLEGKYNPMEYNAVRNKVAYILNKIFNPIT